MSANSPQAEPGRNCSHPACCLPETAATEAAALHPGEALGNRPATRAGAVPGAFKRWLLWFLTFFGIYASSSMCPFCGTPGCPVGAGGAALVGGVFAALWQYGKNIWETLKRMVAKLGR